MSPKTKKGLIIGLCSIGGIVVVAGAAMAALLSYTKRELSGLDFSDSEWTEAE